MDENKRVLILTADAGFGHRSAANAVAAALTDLYGEKCTVDIVNPLEDKRTPFYLRDSQSDYDVIVRNIPELYQFGYDASDGAVSTPILESVLTVSLVVVMRDILEKYQPDVIVSTYPLYQTALRAVFTINRYFIPLIVIITDLGSIHRIWFNEKVTACLVPNEKVKELAACYHLPLDRIHITGIPVNPKILNETRSQQEIRTSLDWQPDMTTFLAVGSRRVDNLLDALHVLNHFGSPVQLAVVAGKDDDLYDHLQQVDWHIPVHLYRFVENMPSLMHASDALICKAGGLIVTEALACGLPMLIVHAIPGQETGNAEFVVENKAGLIVQTPIQVLEALAHWTANDKALLTQTSENALRVGKPEAAYTAAKLTWKAGLEGPLKKKRKQLSEQLRLQRLLQTNHVSWQDALLRHGNSKK